MQERSSSPSYRFNWRLLAAAGGVVLLMAAWMRPGDARPAQWDETKQEQSATGLGEDAREGGTGPARVSVLGLLGKASLALLMVYGAGMGLARVKRLSLGSGVLAGVRGEVSVRLQLRETVALGRQEGTLHLVEVDGQALLVGSAGGMLQMLWQAAPEVTASAEVVAPAPEPEDDLPTPRFEAPLFQRGFGAPARRESDWARERSQLISALMQSE